jgi:large subunit ribosomal protein L25
MRTIALKAQVREEIGKGPSRRLRSEGFIPGTFYGYQAEPIVIKVDASELTQTVIQGREETVFVKLGIKPAKGKMIEKLSVIKDLQVDTIKRKPVHVDFYEIRMDRTLAVDVPIVLTGTPAGVENGGEMQQLKRDIRVSGLPSALPESIEVDVTHLGIGDSVKIKDIAASGDVQFLDNDDVALVSVVPTRVSLMVETVEEEEGEVTEEAEETDSTSEGEEQQSE